MSLIGNHPAKQIVILPIPCVVLDGTFPLQPPELAATLQLPSPTAAQNIPKEAAVVEAEPKATTKATESTEKHKVPTTHKPSSPTLVRTQAEIYKSSWPSPIKVSAVLDPRSSVNWISERRLLNLKALLPRVPVSMVQYHEYEGHCLQGDATVTIIWKGTRQMTFSDIFYIASGSETPLELVFGKCSIGKFGKTVDIGRSTKEKDHKSGRLGQFIMLPLPSRPAEHACSYRTAVGGSQVLGCYRHPPVSRSQVYQKTKIIPRASPRESRRDKSRERTKARKGSRFNAILPVRYPQQKV